MKRLWWVTLLGLLLGPGAARADVGTPGFKRQELRVVIDNLDEYPNYAFYLVAGRWVGAENEDFAPGQPNKPERLTPGEAYRPGYAVRWTHKWMLVALPRERVERGGPVDWPALFADAPGVLHSNVVQLAQPPDALFLWPRDYEVRHYRVDLAGGQLKLTPVSVEQGSNGFSSWLPALIATAAITGLGYWIVRRLQRPRPAPASDQASPTSPEASEDGR